MSLTGELHIHNEKIRDVATTFTSTCPYGCVVRTVDGRPLAHVCVGEQVAAALAPDVPIATVQRITEGLRPLLRERLDDAWRAGLAEGGSGGGERPSS